MAGIYSTLFAHGRATATGGSVLYTVPNGYVAIVRDITLETSAGASGYVSILADNGSGAQVSLEAVPAVAASTFYHWIGHQVLNAGDNIRLYTDAQPLGYRVSGYLLSVV